MGISKTIYMTLEILIINTYFNMLKQDIFIVGF